MKIWTISDTHMQHELLTVPDGIDMVIHAGDGTNQQDKYKNEPELRDFLKWMHNLPIKYKIYTGGNHDTALASNLVDIPDDIIILQDRNIEIDGVKIFGSPYSLAFGFGWAYNMSPNKGFKRWNNIDEGTNIVITHGPPKGILDVTRSSGRFVEQTGDKSLLRRIIEINPDFHIFGHLHNESNINNSGIFYNENICKTKFINASVVNLHHGLDNNGHVIEI